MSIARTRAQHAGRRVTFEEYLELPDDGYRYDMVDGVLHVSPSHTPYHGHAQLIFATLVQNYLSANCVGRAYLETDVYLNDGTDDGLRPDICVVLNENADRVDRTHIHGAPDLVVEFLSDRTAIRDLGIKADRYLAAGVQEYWIVDPRDRSMQVWFEVGGVWEKRSGNELSSRILPGLLISTQQIFH